MNFPTHDQYPKKIYFRSEKYRVKFCKKLENYGETDPGKLEIRIKKGMSPRETFSTFIHELLHVIELEGPIKLKHRTIHKLEKAILEIFMDNF